MSEQEWALLAPGDIIQHKSDYPQRKGSQYTVVRKKMPGLSPFPVSYVLRDTDGIKFSWSISDTFIQVEERA